MKYDYSKVLAADETTVLDEILKVSHDIVAYLPEMENMTTEEALSMQAAINPNHGNPIQKIGGVKNNILTGIF